MLQFSFPGVGEHLKFSVLRLLFSDSFYAIIVMLCCVCVCVFFSRHLMSFVFGMIIILLKISYKVLLLIFISFTIGTPHTGKSTPDTRFAFSSLSLSARAVQGHRGPL